MRLSPSMLKPWQVGALLGAVLAAAVVVPLALGIASVGEGRVYDLLLRARSTGGAPGVILVGIDDASFKTLGDRMPTRAEYARALTRVWDAGASLVGLDILFTGAKGPEEDAALAGALSKCDAVIAANPAAGQEPVEMLRKQALGTGSIDLLTDSDGVLRRLPPPYAEPTAQGLSIRQMPFALACAVQVWFPSGPPAARLEGDTLRLGLHPFPVGRKGWLIPFSGGDGTLPRLSFSDLLDDRKPLLDLKGKVVLIGSTRATQHDYFSVPLPAVAKASAGFTTVSTHTMAGVEVHGQALSALLQGQAIRMPGPSERALLFGGLAAVGTLLIALPLRPVVSVTLWLLLGAVLLGAAVAAMRGGLALPLLAMGLAWAAYAGVSLSHHWYRDFQEKRAVQRLFARYVSPNVARELLAHPDLVQLGGRRKTLTILFSDIRGFTNLSERIPPEQVSALLNEYFTVMTQVLFRYDGTLDKFIGDAILAFFGDPLDQPDQSARALACAVAMQEEAARLREAFEAEGKPPLRIGIAVHTGPAVVGNNGSENNFLYTVIGDTVNLTARLQGLAVKDDVITTVETAERIGSMESLYRIERLDPVMVKGKAEPIPILRVIGRA